MKWFQLLLMGATLLGFAPFFWGGPDIHNSRSFCLIWNLGHILFFALFSYWILFFWKSLQRKSFTQQCFCILGFTLLAGGVLEILQKMLDGRTADLNDIVRNLIGALVFLAFGAASRKRVKIGILRSLQLFAVLCVSVQLYPLASALTDEWRAHQKFPMLADFETPGELSRWQGNAEFSISADIAFHGRFSLQVYFQTTKYSSVLLNYFPRNWSGFRALRLHAFNPSQKPVPIHIRIHDRQHTQGEQHYHDRFRRKFLLKPGWNSLHIPMDDIENAPQKRQMDIRQILGVGLFTVQLPRQQVIYLDAIQLLGDER